MSENPIRRSPRFLKTPVTQREGSTNIIGLKFKNKEKGMTIHKICLKGYELKKYLAEGSYGTIYQACDIEKNCNYALKIQNPDPDKWLIETKNTAVLSMKYNIGPKFLGAWLCEEDRTGIIVTELWDGNLTDECLPKHLIDKLQKQINTINKSGFVHGDILPQNILIKKDKEDEIIDVTLTDFGTVSAPEDWQKDEKDYHLISKFYFYHLKNDTTREYYKDNKMTSEDVIKDPFHLDKALMYHFSKHCKK